MKTQTKQTTQTRENTIKIQNELTLGKAEFPFRYISYKTS